METEALKILEYYSENNSNSFEINEALNFLKNNELQVLPYDEIKEFNPTFDIHFDSSKKLHYVFFEDKKMFFKRSMSKFEIKLYLESVLKEQHINSPHRYLIKSFDVEFGSVVADVGVAEGIFSLSIIDKVSSIYMFEPDKEWVEALYNTFEPWKNKIKIIEKFISEEITTTSDTLDNIFQEDLQNLSFLKVDVDGGEKKLLNGASKLLKHNNNLKIALCTYHNQNDEIEFLDILKLNNFNCSLSKGYILYYFDKNFHPPFFRKGLIRANKL